MITSNDYGRLPAMPAILFYCCSLYLFSPPNLLGCLAERRQSLPCLMVTQIYKIRSEIWVAPSPKIWRSKSIKFWRGFTQLSDLIANISTMQRHTVNWKMVLQTIDTPAQVLGILWSTNGENRTGVLTHTTGSHQAGHCHASSLICAVLVNIHTVCNCLVCNCFIHQMSATVSNKSTGNDKKRRHTQT